MYPSCENLTESMRELSICAPIKINGTEEPPPFDEELERIVSLTVFVLFGFIFVAGLIGNALVVIGKLQSTFADQASLMTLFIRSCRFQSSHEINDQSFNY